MGELKPPKKYKLICGILYSDEELLSLVIDELLEKFGPSDSKSKIISFTQTNYYKDELGEKVNRLFLSFEKPISGSFIVDAKLFTQEIEEKYSNSDGKRKINLDPGYISEGKLVLATTKDHQHRIYMDRGIFAEITLKYDGKSKNFAPWPWTYRDYKTEEYINYFLEVRNLLRKQLGRNVK